MPRRERLAKLIGKLSAGMCYICFQINEEILHIIRDEENPGEDLQTGERNYNTLVRIRDAIEGETNIPMDICYTDYRI